MAPWGGNQCPLPALTGQRVVSVDCKNRQHLCPQFQSYHKACIRRKGHDPMSIPAAYLDIQPHIVVAE